MNNFKKRRIKLMLSRKGNYRKHDYHGDSFSTSPLLSLSLVGEIPKTALRRGNEFST